MSVCVVVCEWCHSIEKKGWYFNEIYDRSKETLNNIIFENFRQAFSQTIQDIHTFVIFIKESDALSVLSIPYRHIVIRRNVNV